MAAPAPIQFAGPIPIAWDSRGEGEPALLMFGGWCAPRSLLRALASKSSARRRVLTLDWRGHGQSGKDDGDFGQDALVEDALAVLEESRTGTVIPVALAHSGWVAIELARRLGPRVPKIVLVDWLVLAPPPPFLKALDLLQEPESWRETRDRLFEMWTEGVDKPDVVRFVREEMGSFDSRMWGRAGAAIARAYRRHGRPLDALADLDPPRPVLHLYAQPADPGFLSAQQEFARRNPWFSVERLDAKSHFPMLEAPDVMTDAIEAFAR